MLVDWRGLTGTRCAFRETPRHEALFVSSIMHEPRRDPGDRLGTKVREHAPSVPRTCRLVLSNLHFEISRLGGRKP